MEEKHTLRLSARNPGDVDRAATLLRDGGIVAFPTETVYGLGANALQPDAVARIFAAKKRPAWDPLIVHIASIEQLAAIADISVQQDRVHQLAAAFWPGPLTLLLPRTRAIPDSVTAGRDLVGVRIPAHPVAQALLQRAGVPIAAPSANIFGHTSPTTPAHVLADLDGRIDAVLDGGPTSVGVESTVLDPAAMTIYRPGAVTADHIAACTGILPRLFSPQPSTAEPASLPSPGVGVRHYAPRARLQLVPGTEDALRAATKEACSAMLGIMQPTGWGRSCEQAKYFDWGPWHDADTLAARLFLGLRELDDAGVTEIICPTPTAEGLGAAIRDRLSKAARIR